MNRLYPILVLLGALVLAMVACGGQGRPAVEATPTAPLGAATPGAAEVTVRALDFSFSPSRITAQANQPLTVTVRNDGQVPHTFTIQELNVDVTVQPGQSAAATFTPRAASYTFVCRFHARVGMTGTLVAGGGAGGGATTPPAGGPRGYGY